MKMLAHPFRRFRDGEKGTLSVETVLMFPLLMWAYAAMFVYWDAFSMRNDTLAATYTLADLVSRQTASVDPAFVDGMNSLYEVLLNRQNATELRVTVVEMVLGEDPNIDPPKLELNWSHATDGMQPYVNLDDLKPRLPEMAVGASLIVVETQAIWTPAINFGIGAQRLESLVFSSPRFVPQILFQTS